MPVITISADSFELGRGIAAQTAQSLGWQFLDRELLGTLAADGGAAEAEYIKALEEPPAFFSMRARRRQRLLNQIQTAVLGRLVADDVVCYGLGAHLYVHGVSHAIRVRIIGAETGQDPKLTRRAQDNARRWSMESFGLDETDPGLYDLVLNMNTLEQDKIVEIICDAAAYRKFQPMTYSRKCLQDKALASLVRRELLPSFPDIHVQANDGTVVAQVKSLRRDQRRKQKQVREIAGKVPGVDYVEVHVISDFFGQAANSGR